MYMQISNRAKNIPPVYPRRLYHGISHSVVNPACEVAHTRLRFVRDRSGTIDFYPAISAEPSGLSVFPLTVEIDDT